MAAVFFNISDTQEAEVKRLMAEEGYTSKAEFFRFLVKFFKFNLNASETAHLKEATDQLKSTLLKLKKQGKLNKTLDEQLEDL